MDHLNKRNMMAFLQKTVFLTVFLSMSFLMGCIDDEPDPASLLLLNKIPIAAAGPDQSVVNGVLVRLDGSQSSDPEGDTLRYQWSILDAPRSSSASLNDNSTDSPSLVPDIDGTYRISLVVVEVPEIDTTIQADVPFSDQGQSSEPDEVIIPWANRGLLQTAAIS